MEYIKTNREKRLSPKSGKFWCLGCDMNLCSVWIKCSVCGHRNGKRTLKRST